MGTSKLMGERLISAANSLKMQHRTVFTSTRFGNVIGSRGSVVPIFHQQIRNGGPVTLTDPRMNRFVMTIQESARLVLRAAEIARGGEVFVTKMSVMAITDIARVMIDLVAPEYGHDPGAIEIREIGAKPGEKNLRRADDRGRGAAGDGAERALRHPARVPPGLRRH